MGLFRRRATEKTRQKMGMEGKNFEATSKARDAATFAELKAYAKELRQYESACKDHIKQVNGFNRTTHHFLNVRKPRLHEEHKPGESRALEGHASIGKGVDTESLTVSGTDRDEEIYRGVQEPMKKWLVSFDSVQKAMANLEKDRLVVDSRRRTLDQLSHRHENWSKKKRADDPKLLKLKDDKHKQEVKLQQVSDEYASRENAIYGDMQRLIDDVGPIQAHIVRFFEMLREVNDKVVHAFPVDATAALDAHPSGSVAGAHSKGVATHADDAMRPHGRVEHGSSVGGHPGDSQVTKVGGSGSGGLGGGAPSAGVVRPLRDDERLAGATDAPRHV